LSIVTDHIHPIMSTVYPFSDGYLQQDNATLKPSQTVFLNIIMSSLLKWPPQSPYLNPKERLWDVVERDSHHGCASDKSSATVGCYHVNMDKNL